MMPEMLKIFAIDPGHEHSVWVRFGNDRIESGISLNKEIRRTLLCSLSDTSFWIELFEPRGKSLDARCLDTLLWTGRFWELLENERASVSLVSRSKVKLELLGTTKATKADIRNKVIEVLGPKGTKKAPGPTYSVTSHAWDALALAIYADRSMRGALQYR